MRKGSITIFTTLTMLLVASTLFALLETARVEEIKRISKLQTQVALESAFANYNDSLWKEYQLLACEYSTLQEILIAKGNARNATVSRGLNLLLSKVVSINEQRVTRLTDGNGAVYVKEAATSMEEAIAFGAAKQIFNQYEAIQQLLENSSWNWSKVDIGLAEEMEWDTSSAEVNPLQEGKQLYETGILELVIEDTTQLSKQKTDTSKMVSRRSLQIGINPVIPEVDWMDRILFQQYLLQHLSFYGSSNSSRCLSYELEYLIGGKQSDIENLKAVISQILFIREATNFLYLSTDKNRLEEASVLAIALAGASANPLVVDAVKWGIITVWAFGESVLDVRALLQGKRIALLKSSDTWTLELQKIGQISENYFMAKENENGISYKEYLGILLLFQEDAQKAMYAMDVQEATVRLQEGCANFQMDACLIHTEVEVGYAYVPVFSFFTTIEPEIWKNTIVIKEDYSYR